MTVRSNEQTTSLRWFTPSVNTLTIPTLGLEFDSRLDTTVDRERIVSPWNTGAGSLILSHAKFAMTFCDTSVTLWPVTSATVNVESTSGLPNSVFLAYSKSKWIGAVFCVSRVNQMLSVSVIVRPRGCKYTSPSTKSSKKRPCHPSCVVIRTFPLLDAVSTNKLLRNNVELDFVGPFADDHQRCVAEVAFYIELRRVSVTTMDANCVK